MSYSTLRGLIGALVLLSSTIGSAHATLINVNVSFMLDGYGDTVCQPCGPGTINTDGEDFSVSWWGSGGMAHDAFADALAGGLPIFDGNEWYSDYDNLLAANPNALVIDEQDAFNLTVELYEDGDYAVGFNDMLSLADGLWGTSNFPYGDGLVAGFNVISASPIPEPGTFALLLLGLGAASLRNRRVHGKNRGLLIR